MQSNEESLTAYCQMRVYQPIDSSSNLKRIEVSRQTHITTVHFTSILRKSFSVLLASFRDAVCIFKS